MRRNLLIGAMIALGLVLVGCGPSLHYRYDPYLAYDYSYRLHEAPYGSNGVGRHSPWYAW